MPAQTPFAKAKPATMPNPEQAGPKAPSKPAGKAKIAPEGRDRALERAGFSRKLAVYVLPARLLRLLSRSWPFFAGAAEEPSVEEGDSFQAPKPYPSPAL